ncbi:MAG TPA: hypothetical protein VLB68_06940 [Pyrinomonadaceae bacterium]|nr:hypothetical protein [Pyrinomonadaceae bacterium]
MRLLYILIAILAIRLILNLSKYIRAKRYHDEYLSWLTVKRTSKLLEKRAQVVGLLKDAGVDDSYVGIAEPVGFMHVQTGNASVFDNFPSAREDMAGIMNTLLLQAIGTFRSRIWQTFNPLFWIEFLIHLPRHTLRYLGVSPDGVVVKLAQLIWWLACAVFGFFYALYKPELEALIRAWVSRA